VKIDKENKMTAEMLDDDRLDRWYAANGITAMGYRTLADGCVIIEYFRARILGPGSNDVTPEQFAWAQKSFEKTYTWPSP
jgi:hypothetical protein